ncbi:ABC transporter permease [Romboutsia weinsteinii]|uniref:ABC transporter permease n=1 Tax=Romboutsia weinsteinii TaxID=2020949 RepID=A0A371IY26_9FIRM|nr:ABC transporter permease [Romboutsia weinsteinii]RDY25392.1 ABC transporter permease [Romboutsia weinsteinii]
MYVKLAINNASKAVKDYLIYFITITMCVSLFYAFTSLSSSGYELITEDTFNFENLKKMLKYSTYFITAILALLVAYVSKYMIKRRQKEFATYILLGAEQRVIALMFFVEMLLVGVLAIVCGIFVGTLFSQVVTAMVYMSTRQEIVFSFKLYWDTIGITFAFFIGMFCLVGVYNIRVLNKLKLIDMMNSSRVSEFKFKRSKRVYTGVFLISIALYSIFVYSSKFILDSKDNASGSNSVISTNQMLLVELVSLISFILGTYALFYSIAYILIRIKEKWVNFRYEGTNLFLLGSIVSKIKTAPILMATISLTFLGASISLVLTLLMSQWSLGFLDYRVPFDIEIRTAYSDFRKDEKRSIHKIEDMPEYNYSQVINHLENSGVEINEYEEVEKYFIGEDDFYKRDRYDTPALAISLSDFNKLRSMQGYEKVHLDNNEYTTQWDRTTEDTEIDKYIKENKVIKVGDKDLAISENTYYKESLGEGIYNFPASNVIILPDEICKKLLSAGVNLFVTTDNKMSYEDAIKFEDEYIPTWFENNNKELMKNYDDSYYFADASIKSAETSEIVNATLGMRILGLYLGTVLLMISLTVLALSQLTDSIEHRDRFEVLRKLGIEEHKISKIVLKQISIYFIIPVVIGVIGFVVFIYNFYLVYESFIASYIGDNLFVLNMIVGIVLMIMIYVSYFVGTYYTFNRNIKN